MEIQEKIDILEKRIEQLEAVILKKKSESKGNAKRFNQLNDLDMKIKSVLESKEHPMLLGLDLVYSDRLFMILEQCYPDIPYFQYTKSGYTNPEERSSKIRSLGARMRKLGYKSLRARYYESAHDGGSRTRSAWVLNGYHEYSLLPETEVAITCDEQWADAFRNQQHIHEEVTFK